MIKLIFCSTRMKAEEEEEDAEAEKGRDTNGREDSTALLCKHKCPYFFSLFESKLGKYIVHTENMWLR